VATVGKVGAPPKFNDEEIAEIYQDFSDYIKRTADPTVVGFTAYYEKHDIRRTYLTDRAEFSDLVKKAVEKQEAYVVAGAIQNKLNSTFAIFRLKQPQHGWRDQSQLETTGEVKHTYEELDDEQLEAALKARQDRVSPAA
jgi:hypothetical protein